MMKIFAQQPLSLFLSLEKGEKDKKQSASLQLRSLPNFNAYWALFAATSTRDGRPFEALACRVRGPGEGCVRRPDEGDAAADDVE